MGDGRWAMGDGNVGGGRQSYNALPPASDVTIAHRPSPIAYGSRPATKDCRNAATVLV